MSADASQQLEQEGECLETPVHWRSFGAAGTTATPLLLLHGFMGTGDDWRPTADMLRPQRQCVCPDLPGHGRATPCADAGLCFTGTAEALARTPMLRSRKRCALGGYSMGGRLALYMALRYPERFTCLILESASPGLEGDGERRKRQSADTVLATRLEAIGDDKEGFDAFLRTWYAQPLFSALTRQYRRFETLLERRMKNDPRQLACALRALGLGVQPDLWTALPRVSLPVLLITGELDRKFCMLATRMADRMPNATLAIIPTCGHNPHYEQPNHFAAILNSFLQKNAPNDSLF